MKKVSLLFIIQLLLSIIGFGQTVSIGTQVWTVKNLDVSTFRNGDLIPEAKTDAEWKKAGENNQPAWCYYNNDPTNGAKYGKLYNWYAVNDRRGLAPAGYHIPSEAEWDKLAEYLGGGWDADWKMKGKSGWFKDRNGSNSSGFSGLPGGSRTSDGAFYDFGKGAKWWSITELEKGKASGYTISYLDVVVIFREYKKTEGFSVRCLKD